MEQKLREILEMQRKLDERIIIEHNLNSQYRIPNIILALWVELGELANETRCFKDWSLKEPSAREVILEEFVDGIHFINSLIIITGNEEFLQIIRTDLDFTRVDNKSDLVAQFSNIYSVIALFRDHYLEEYDEDNAAYNLVSIYNQYLALGSMLGFTFDDIYNAYMEKNKINHERQDIGY